MSTQPRSLSARAAAVVAVLLTMLLCTSSVVSAYNCMDAFEVDEGKPTTVTLKWSWMRRACPSGVVLYQVKNQNGHTASFPSMYAPRLQITPSPSASTSYVEIDALCNGITSLCTTGEIYFMVKPSTSTPPTSSTTTTTTTSTTAPGSSTSTSTTTTPTTTAEPGAPPVCPAPMTVETWIGEAIEIRPLDSVKNCVDPATAVIENQPASGLFTVRKDPSTNEPVVVFDANGVVAEEGTFGVTVRVQCSNANPVAANDCAMELTVVAKKHIVEPSPTPLPTCTGPYVFRTTFNTLSEMTIDVSDADASLCPVASGSPRHLVLAALSAPARSPDRFVFNSTGTFTYLAPPGPSTKPDSFKVSIGCAEGKSPVAGETVHELCQSNVSILITAPAPSACTGDFHYRYALNADGTYTPTVSSLAGRASVVRSERCPSNKYTAATLTTVPAAGTISDLDAATGKFTYTPAASTGVVASENADSFAFKLTCADDPSVVCTGTAAISFAVAERNETVYHLHDNRITCKGTCDAQSTTRQDGRQVGTLDLDFTVNGTLLIRAYTSISNLQAQFVTFTPLVNATGFLTSAVAPLDSHVSFEPTCLDAQSTYGSAANVLSWDDTGVDVTSVSQMTNAHLNRLTDNYRLGENYFQKFGGKHQHCDVFRENPCKLAPLMTPTTKDGAADASSTPVQWQLFINGCDATWVGEASVESLRALRQPNGDATFRLVDDSKLDGTIYLQTVAPANVSDASKGIVTKTATYKVLVSIRNTLVVDVAANEMTQPPSPTDVDMASDIQFAVGRDRNTNERIYAYSIILYPSRTVNGALASVNTSQVKMERMFLDHFAFTSPNRVECPECTGTMTTCEGTGVGFDTDCGDKGIVSFGAIDEDAMEYDRTEQSPGGANLFPSTSLASQKNYYNLTFAMRANGAGSATSADAYPVGYYTLVMQLSNGQQFKLQVSQTDYVSEINSKYLRSRMCRASAYWPVADALGASVPILPYNATGIAGVAYDEEGELIVEAEGEGTATYAAPSRLSSAATCSLPPMDLVSPLTKLTSVTATVGNVTASMCAVEEEGTYGVTDWYVLSLPSIHEEREKIHNEVQQQVIEDSSLADDAYTVADLQYMVLSLDISEAVAATVAAVEPSQTRLNILLDGDHPPQDELSEEDRWMSPNAEHSVRTTYYNWAEYASFLNYRRIQYEYVSKPATVEKKTVDPFNFAFIPGALLHSSSSVRVPMRISMAIKFTTYARTKGTDTTAEQPVVIGEREEKLSYIISVSRGISAAMRFDSDAYTPQIVTVKVPGLGRKSATALLIVILIAVAVVLAASIYTEVTYRRIIHRAKYHPKRPDSAVGVRYGRDGQPIASGPGESVTSSRPGTSEHPPISGMSSPSGVKGSATSTAIKTQFGVVGTEPTRVRDLGDEADSGSNDAEADSSSGRGGEAAAGKSVGETKPPIGDEQHRINDSEVASQA